MSELVCEEHNNPFSQLQISNQRARLICEECFIEKSDQKNQIDVQNIIYLKKAANSIAYFMSKTNIRDSFPNLIDQICKFDEIELKKQQIQFENKIKALQSQLEIVSQEIKTYSQFLVQTRKEILKDFSKAIRFENFQQLYQNLESSTDDSNPDIINQIEYQFYQYYYSIQNNQQKIKEDLVEIFRRYSLKLEKSPEMQLPTTQIRLYNLIDDFNRAHSAFFLASKPIYSLVIGYGNIIDSSLLHIGYISKLFSAIEGKKNLFIKQADLIYKGTKDGLNSNAFWQKINNKQNLLMIFKQKQTNYIFGGYSPCQWKKEINSYVQDNTLSSFLFSQTNNQIYPLKQECKQNAIYCNYGCGPNFGGGNDLYICGNFQSGYSNLGHSYQLDQSLMNQKATILFGATTPNIEECEIYEIVFSQ